MDNQTPTGLPEWLNYLIAVLLLPAIAAGWRWFGGPFWQFFTHSKEDEREYRQEAEARQADFERLQTSWQQDRLSTILEETESFVRDRVWSKLDKIEKAIDDRLYKVELTLNQFKAQLETHARNIYELEKRQRSSETKLQLLIELLTGEKRDSEE